MTGTSVNVDFKVRNILMEASFILTLLFCQSMYMVETAAVIVGIPYSTYVPIHSFKTGE